MRKIDKKLNMMKANLLAEQRYLESKGLLSEMMYPVNAGGEKKMAFAEEEEKNIPKYAKYTPIKGSFTFTEVGEKGQGNIKVTPSGEPISGEMEEGLRKALVAASLAFYLCTTTSCNKVDNGIMYKYVYDTEQSLDYVQESGKKVRTTCLVPSDTPLENDINEYNKTLALLRKKYKEDGIKPLKGDTIVRVDDNTTESPYIIKDKNGKATVDYEKVKLLNGGE